MRLRKKMVPTEVTKGARSSTRTDPARAHVAKSKHKAVVDAELPHVSFDREPEKNGPEIGAVLVRVPAFFGGPVINQRDYIDY